MGQVKWMECILVMTMVSMHDELCTATTAQIEALLSGQTMLDTVADWAEQQLRVAPRRYAPIRRAVLESLACMLSHFVGPASEFGALRRIDLLQYLQWLEHGEALTAPMTLIANVLVSVPEIADRLQHSYTICWETGLGFSRSIEFTAKISGHHFVALDLIDSRSRISEIRVAGEIGIFSSAREELFALMGCPVEVSLD